MMRSTLWLAAAAVLLTTSSAWSACTVNVSGVSFGSYDTFEIGNLHGAGSIDVTCDVSTTYYISMSPGQGSFAARLLLNGSHQLFYNLYIGAARVTVWGDGTGNTVTVSRTGIAEQHTVYASIPARQNAFIGSYADTVVVTVTF